MGGKKRDDTSSDVSQHLYGGTDIIITRTHLGYLASVARLEVRNLCTQCKVNYSIATFSFIFIWSLSM